MTEYVEIMKSLTELEEIREKLIKLDKFVLENKSIEKRLPVKNMADLEDYYNKVKDLILEKIKSESLISIPRVINSKKIVIDARTTLIMDSGLRERNALVEMFNKDFNGGAFDGTILQDGIFLPAFHSRYIEHPPSYLFLDPETGRPNYNIMSVRFLFDKNAMLKNEAIDEDLRNRLMKHIFKTDELEKNDYTHIRTYFLETAPFVLNCLLSKFKEAYIYAKQENEPIALSTAMINTGSGANYVIVLETLYNELLKQDVFKDTIFEGSTTAVTMGNTKFFNPILMDPISECYPLKQYNIRLMLNTEFVENNSEKRLCYNNPR